MSAVCCVEGRRSAVGGRRDRKRLRQPSAVSQRIPMIEQLILPRFQPTPTRLKGAATPDVFAFSRAARTFTGDFYFTHREHDLLWFTLGDVSGKGLPAAVVMAMIQEELEHRIISCAATRCDPSTTMLRLHTFLRPLM